MSMIARRRTVDACADLARASARARMAGEPDPAAEAELLAWWAREFAALGARAEALRCARAATGLPWRRRAGLLGDVLRGGTPQAVWT
jgi:hypothetical protein